MENKKEKTKAVLRTILIIIGVIGFFAFWTIFIMINAKAGSLTFIAFIIGIYVTAIVKSKQPPKVKPKPIEKKVISEESKEKIDKILDALKAKTEITSYNIKCEEAENIGIYDSKFGGIPYWDLSKEYPSDSFGNKLVLLAQINFEKEKFDDERLPNNGILQFYASQDDVCGIDLKNQDLQKDWKVVFHEEIDRNVTNDDIMKLDIPTSLISAENKNTFFPIEKEYKLSFERVKSYMSNCSYNFNDVIKDILKNDFNEDISDEKTLYDYFESEEIDYLMQSADGFGHKLLGYPGFTQTDPREGSYGAALRYYNTLLLQIDSQDGIMWGDSGVCNFFINDKDLKKGDFSRILYNWDCY